jgi:peroxiredoxin
MSSKRPLDATLAHLKAKASPASRAFYDAISGMIAASNLLANALRPGDVMPEFALVDGTGRLVTSQGLLERGPLVLSFYRGAWCPYCRTELDALQEAHPAIEATGATLVAISPEHGGISEATRAERGLYYPVLMDMDHGLALAFGLLYRLTAEQRAYYLSHGIDLPAINGVDGWFMPVPATYVVRTDGIVATAFLEPDPRERMEPDSILASLRAIVAADPRAARHATPDSGPVAGTLRSRG